MKKGTKILKGVKMFRDFNFTDPWNKYGDGDFDVEFKGDKARVICQQPFSEGMKSKFNKVTPIGAWTGGEKPNRYGYMLTVNGYKAHFICEHNINADV